MNAWLRSPWVLTALFSLGLALDPAPAFAGKKADVAGAFVFFPFTAALIAFPVGLAFHALLLGYAPRRGLGLVARAEGHRLKTTVLGLLNLVFLLFVIAATSKPAPGLAATALLLGLMLALIGSHGLARSLGRRVLGPTAGAGELKPLALGWFVLVFASAFPGVGLVLGAYWATRSIGTVCLTLFSVPEAPATQGQPQVKVEPRPPTA